ncbi:MAG: hypothetical protein A2172_03770 [Candidatus Woykebacteria bacterium RBG_13_40_15]|uniref:LamG-like jellyroll fold domain-containing protein n=1 Tax=Candidatus Woykebacteria bacterium RBG_13_40_15 TaxID=1802593 RepID=A0A1G1W6H9_9BACT|nr:MAG: hypothetical protein A2172_03770 [Candidatus Woykebacteria bacterium RBG_13_40_15]
MRLIVSLTILSVALLIPTVLSFSPDANTSFYVPFNDCIGSVVDESIHAGHGTATGTPTWLTYPYCIDGCCLSLDGTNDAVTFLESTNPLLDQTGAITIAYWLRDMENGTTEGAYPRVIMGKDNAFDADRPNYMTAITNSQETRYQYRTGTTLRSIDGNMGNNNLWQCVVVTKNSTAGTIYIDGNMVASMALAGYGNANNNPLYIGFNGTTQYTKMIIDELVIENISQNQTWVNSFCNATFTSCDAKCTSWISQNNCTNGFQLYTRSCLDEGLVCETETYNATNYCANILNETIGIYTQGTESYSNSSYCESGWATSGTAECYFSPIRVPSGCTNIESTVSTGANLRMGWGLWENRGNMTTNACVPSTDCDIKEVDCFADNETGATRNYSSYSSGDLVTAKAQLNIPISCMDTTYFGRGIYEYQVVGTLDMNCDKLCTNGWLCMDELNSGYKQISCGITNVTPCSNGCNKATGLCNGTDLGGSVGEGNRALGAFARVFNPTPSYKLMYALFVSGIVTVIGGAVSKWKNLILPMLFFSGGWVFFTFISWIPAIFTIIIIAGVGVAFYLSNK